VSGGLRLSVRAGPQAPGNRLCHAIASLHGSLRLFAILLQSGLEVLGIDLLHVAKRVAMLEPLRDRNVLPDASMHKLVPVVADAREPIEL
jgi:hypothetical protein